MSATLVLEARDLQADDRIITPDGIITVGRIYSNVNNATLVYDRRGDLVEAFRSSRLFEVVRFGIFPTAQRDGDHLDDGDDTAQQEAEQAEEQGR